MLCLRFNYKNKNIENIINSENIYTFKNKILYKMAQNLSRGIRWQAENKYVNRIYNSRICLVYFCRNHKESKRDIGTAEGSISEVRVGRHMGQMERGEPR